MLSSHIKTEDNFEKMSQAAKTKKKKDKLPKTRDITIRNKKKRDTKLPEKNEDNNKQENILKLIDKEKKEEQTKKDEPFEKRDSSNIDNDIFFQAQKLSALTRGSSENNPEKMIKNVRLDIENLKKRIKDNFTN